MNSVSWLVVQTMVINGQIMMIILISVSVYTSVLDLINKKEVELSSQEGTYSPNLCHLLSYPQMNSIAMLTMVINGQIMIIISVYTSAKGYQSSCVICAVIALM